MSQKSAVPKGKCTICHDHLDYDDPLNTTYGVNPETKRAGYMHIFCYEVALETLLETSSNDLDYDNLGDEYLSKYT